MSARSIRLRYFASLREAIGHDSEAVALPPQVDSVAALRRWLRERGEPYASAMAEGRALRAAVDQSMADGDTPLAEGAEVAFFPPVTGG